MNLNNVLRSWRRGSGTPRTIARSGQYVLVQIGQFQLWLDPSRYIDGELMRRGVFESSSIALVDRLVKPGMFVIDVGANIGYYTVRLSSLVGLEGHVLAVEPSPYYIETLQMNIAANSCGNVDLATYALSDSEESAPLYGNFISASLDWPGEDPPPSRTEDVSRITLDRLCEIRRVTRIDFMKVDVDGHEVHLFNGAEKTLGRFRPTMFVEFSQKFLMAAGSDVPALARVLSGHDYAFVSERSRSAFPSLDALYVEAFNFSHSVNVLCVPHERLTSVIAAIN